jgi:hypothetical protein
LAVYNEEEETSVKVLSSGIRNQDERNRFVN